jgi:hypothetical protein
MFSLALFFVALVAFCVTVARMLLARFRPGLAAAPTPQAGGEAATSGMSEGAQAAAAAIATLRRRRPGFILAGSAIVMLFTFWYTSVVNPSGTQIAQFTRIYGCKAIGEGRNVALANECGRQAQIRMPGFGIEWFANVLNDIDYIDMVTVPDGHYAILSARDGANLSEGQVAARPWPLGPAASAAKDDKTTKDAKVATGTMLDATHFLEHGGQKGPQATILTPGTYPINKFLWDVQTDVPVFGTDGKTALLDKDGKKQYTGLFVRTKVETGFVGVVKSAINEDFKPSFVAGGGEKVNCSAEPEVVKAAPASSQPQNRQLKAILVSVGCRGVWKEPLPPGEYFINTNIYKVEMHDTRMQNLILAGGYKRRVIDITVENDGSVKQHPHDDEVKRPDGAVGDAVAVKVEGWTVMQELRVQFRTLPEYAPLQAASLGGLKEVEERIIIPQAISVLRNIGGSNITVKNTTAFEEAKSELNALKARLEVLKDPSADVGLNPEQRGRETAALERQIAGFALPDPAQSVTRPTRVLDFQNERQALEELVAQAIGQIGQEAGIEVVSVTFGNPDIPPELLVARKIEQLSGQLRNAYTQMRTAQVQRQATEAATARANQQKDLVTAQIGVEKSKLGIDQRTNEGVAEQKYNEAFALGQKAQVDVLGQDKVMMLRIVEKMIDAVKEKPEIINQIKLPGTMVLGSSGPFDGPAAILRGAMGGNDNSAPAPTIAAKR